MSASFDLAGYYRRLLRERSATYAQVREAVHHPKPKTLVLQNLPGGALAYVAGTLAEELHRPLLVLTAGIERSTELVDDLEFFGLEGHTWPKWEVLPYDREELSAEVTARTLDVFAALEQHGRTPAARRAPLLLTAPVDSLMQRILPRREMAARTIAIAWGDSLDARALEQRLESSGYERQPIVESRGEFAIRGNIVDVFPPNADDPVRFDFFGDEIESIRIFDVSTQRSRDTLGTDAVLHIPPARLKMLGEKHLESGGALESFLEYLPEDTLVLLENPERHDEVCTHFEQTVERTWHEVYKESEDLPPPQKLILTRAELLRRLDHFQRAEHSLLPFTSSDPSTHRISFDSRGYALSSTDAEGWMQAFRKLQEGETILTISCDNDGQVQRLDDLLREHHLGAQPIYSDGAGLHEHRGHDALKGKPDIVLLSGVLSSGFHLPEIHVGFLTDREMFGRYKRRPVYRKIYKGRPIKSSSEISRGDYIVHVEHGIGKYLGMRQQVLDGKKVDLIELLYADNNKLLVPVEKIRLVQKYAGMDTGEPTLDKLGSGRWQKRRDKSREKIEEIANELLALYAKREVARRRPYPPDTRLMREFEASFLFEETTDQTLSIAAIKEDLEGPRPMDRVVCGDVGYGKTEVAMRAIFKAVDGGRQAALLCPTTLLAQQHYNTIRERFADFPYSVEVVSRFRSPKEVKKSLKDLKDGKLHILVGTHRLLSKDVQFLDLGLVVVDEEHRFGVKAKERLKELRADVDFLTLSATPIPRTLHMALSGLRDFSLIQTPPANRHPIRTRIIPFEQEQIAEAILRELNRGGQVYFIHNRVANIQEVARRLQEIVPHARIVIGHGQMDETELEEVMAKFVDQQFDILVATTIIESGIDIPNCNTIIINRADAFGLSQLYQLRGRVGRERRRAYAYLIVPPGEAITETAVKRLEAIQEFTELGAGFNLAMRDMEIRGTGNLLGKEQSGSINEIGFELYTEMLREAVSRLRGDEVFDDRDAEIKADISCVLPQEFIPIESQRLTFYKRIAVARELPELDEIAAELRDRYGELPPSVQALLHAGRIRIVCRRLHISSVRQSGARVRVAFHAPEARDWEPDFRTVARTGNRFSGFTVEGTDAITFVCAEKEPLAILAILPPFLEEVEAAGNIPQA